MDTAKKWQVEIFIDEHDNRTRAKARLHTRENVMTGTGFARLNPVDTDVPEIGDELAVSRALFDLAHQLLETTSADIEAITHKGTHLAR